MRAPLRSLVVTLAFLAPSLSPSSDAQAQIPDKAIQGVVDHICSDGGEWLQCYSLEPKRCHEITASYVRPCVDKTLGTGEIDQGDVTAADMIQNLLRCLNHEFMGKYGLGKRQTPECEAPPKHLQ